MITTSLHSIPCFNTQPPEGDRLTHNLIDVDNYLFQHTAARRRPTLYRDLACLFETVSTHSRPKATESRVLYIDAYPVVSTHSRPKATECWSFVTGYGYIKFQHTAARRRPKTFDFVPQCTQFVSTHSRPKATDLLYPIRHKLRYKFQHTAARRRPTNPFPTPKSMA